MSSVNSDDRIRELEDELEEKTAILDKNSKYIEELKSDLEFRTEYLNKKIDNLTASYKKASSDYLEIQNSSSWRMTRFFRNTITFLRDFLKNHIMVKVFLELLKSFISSGPKSAVTRYGELKQELLCHKLRCNGFAVTAEEMKLQQKTKFGKDIRISLIVPLKNVSSSYLRTMIDSIEAQTYTDWELCLCYESDDQHRNIKTLCEKYSRKDSRIRSQQLKSSTQIINCYKAASETLTGDYLSILDQNDVLHPYTLFEVVTTIDGTDADFIYTDEIFFNKTPKEAFNPIYKSGFAPDSLCGTNYIRQLSVFKRTLIDENRMFDLEYDGVWNYDLILRLTEKACKVVHIPKILCYVRAYGQSGIEAIAVNPVELESGRKAVEAHIERSGYKGHVSIIKPNIPIYKVQYEIVGRPLVSILIPNCDHTDDLKKCINSIVSKTSYSNYEILIIENNSTADSVFDYYKELQTIYGNVRVIVWNGAFNYSAINNYGVRHCSGDYYLFLNNDTEIITADWIEQMLMYAQRDDVGAVGAKLYYPDDTIQHAGIGLGLQELAGHLFQDYERDDTGYMGRLMYTQNVSAVTAACMMLRKSVFEKINGFNEIFGVAFNDVDLCIRVRRAGYCVVWTPFAELYHYESKSRGSDNTILNHKRFENEFFKFHRQWETEIAAGDPYFNPSIST